MIDITDYRAKSNNNLQQFLQLLSQVPAEALQYKQAEEWNLLEILDHIIVTESLVMSTISKESGNFSDNLELFGFGKLQKLLIDYRHKKVKAPSGLEPRKTNLSLQDLLLEFQNQRNRLMDEIQNGSLWMSAEVYPHPMLGEMTVIDWLHFILLHSQRHFLQMQDQLQRYKETTKG